MRFALLGAGAALVLVIAAGCSSGERAHDRADTRATSQAIQGGADDTSNTYRYAVGVCVGNRTQCYQGICSGALITPNIVVTARHCVDQIQYNNASPSDDRVDCKRGPTFVGRKAGPFWITTGYQMLGGSTATPPWRQVQKIVVPQDNKVCKNDVALLVLSSLVPGAEAKPVIPGVQYPINYQKYLGQFTAIGYGNTGPNGGGAGTRRIRQGIRILCIPGDTSLDCPPGFETGEFVAGDGTCSGDSGSSAFEQLTFEQGAPVSFGVLSRGGTSEDGTACEGSIYTRLDAFRDLVVDTANAESKNWTLYPKPSPDWTIYVPPAVSDGGTKDGGGTSSSVPQGAFGEGCEANEVCTSNICAEGLCTRACNEADETTACPDGYSCREGLCLPPLAGPSDPQSATTTTTESCSAGPALRGGGALPWGSLTLAGVVVLGVARRRRDRKNPG